MAYEDRIMRMAAVADRNRKAKRFRNEGIMNPNLGGGARSMYDRLNPNEMRNPMIERADFNNAMWRQSQEQRAPRLNSALASVLRGPMWEQKQTPSYPPENPYGLGSIALNDFEYSPQNTGAWNDFKRTFRDIPSNILGGAKATWEDLFEDERFNQGGLASLKYAR
jgi:hypothetical protein